MIKFVKKRKLRFVISFLSIGTLTLFSLNIEDFTIVDLGNNNTEIIDDNSNKKTVISGTEGAVIVAQEGSSVEVYNTVEYKSENQINKEIYDKEGREILLSYYRFINQRKYPEAFNLLGESLLSDLEKTNEKDFFKSMRTNRFMNQIDGEYRVGERTLLETHSSDNEERIVRRYEYYMSYNINRNQYLEKRNSHIVYRIEKDVREINTIDCETELCVNLPYFNPLAR